MISWAAGLPWPNLHDYWRSSENSLALPMVSAEVYALRSPASSLSSGLVGLSCVVQVFIAEEEPERA